MGQGNSADVSEGDLKRAHSGVAFETQPNMLRGKSKIPPSRKLIHFDTLTKREWRKRLELGDVFRYKLETNRKTIDGKFLFEVTLVKGRSQKRPLGAKLESISLDFNPDGFHFGKIRKDELLYTFQNDPVHGWELSNLQSEEDIANLGEDSNFVIINVSPSFDNHILLVPQALQGHPQQMNFFGLHTAISLAAHSYSQHLRLFFNSLGAGASVNHLHIQAVSFFEEEDAEHEGKTTDFQLAIERSDVEVVFEDTDTIEISELKGYPLHAIVFKTKKDLRAASLYNLAVKVMLLLEVVQSKGIAHNMMFTQFEHTQLCVYVILRKASLGAPQGKSGIIDNILIGSFEVSGVFICPNEKVFDEVSSEESLVEILETARLDEDEFLSVKGEFV